MSITFTTARRAPTTAHVVAHGVTTEGFEDGSGLPDGVEAGALGRLGFEAKAEQVQVLPSGERLVALVGLGTIALLGYRQCERRSDEKSKEAT